MSWFCERQELVALKGRLQATGSAVWPGQAGGGELTGGTRLTWMLAIKGWTKTSVGALVAPAADAVTLTTPLPPARKLCIAERSNCQRRLSRWEPGRGFRDCSRCT